MNENLKKFSVYIFHKTEELEEFLNNNNNNYWRSIADYKVAMSEDKILLVVKWCG